MKESTAIASRRMAALLVVSAIAIMTSSATAQTIYYQMPSATTQVVTAQPQVRYVLVPASAQVSGQVCPKCGKVHASDPQYRLRSAIMPNRSAGSAMGGSGQAMAQQRARFMRDRNLRNHPPRSAGDFAQVAGFEGVGWTSNPNGTPGTCIPGRRSGIVDTSGPNWQLVGDAIERGPSGAYRVRLWSQR